MRIKKWIFKLGLALPLATVTTVLLAQPINDFGQVINIRTNLKSWLGKPTWLLIIRDVDHNQVIPYIFDITKSNNYWVAFSYSNNYLVTVSELTFNPYDRKIYNFCDLESMGAIQRGTSMEVLIQGNLTQNTDSFTCNVLKYTDPNFNISSSD
jgi:hypothetical protein